MHRLLFPRHSLLHTPKSLQLTAWSKSFTSYRSHSTRLTGVTTHIRNLAMTVTAPKSTELQSEWVPTTIDSATFVTFGKPVQKSTQDDRAYRVIKLNNGLEAMLVHDAKADKAAASLDVAVGHLWDPVSVFFVVKT